MAWDPEAILSRLEWWRPVGGGEEVCAICCDDLGRGAHDAPVVALPCRGAVPHAFHRACVARYLRNAAGSGCRIPRCPTCRDPIAASGRRPTSSS